MMNVSLAAINDLTEICSGDIPSSQNVTFSIIVQLRAENILRSHPESRLARELHLSSIEALEQSEKQKMKEAAIGGVAVAAAVGAAAGIASLLLTKR